MPVSGVLLQSSWQMYQGLAVIEEFHTESLHVYLLGVTVLPIGFLRA